MSQHRKRVAPSVLALCVVALACDEPTDPLLPGCEPAELPVQGHANAPIVVDVALEVQGDRVVVLATATDPQGSADLADVEQTIRVHEERACEGGEVTLADDLSESGVEEAFGTAFTRDDNASRFDFLASVATWPVEVDFVDVDGNRTAALVNARVVAD